MQSTPMPREIIKIEVEIGNGAIPINDYAKGLHDALCFNAYHSMLPNQPLSITVDEILWYLEALLEIRVSVINQEFKDRYLLKNLFIPSFFQMILSLIGKVHIRERGIELIPIWKKNSSSNPNPVLQEGKGQLFPAAKSALIDISNKFGYYERAIHLEKAAMPSNPEGDHDLMMTAVIDGYVCSLNPVSHGFFTYASAFLRMTLAREASFKVLYQIQYDDVELISSYLAQRREILM
jgi:hypothetical protein